MSQKTIKIVSLILAGVMIFSLVAGWLLMLEKLITIFFGGIYGYKRC